MLRWRDILIQICREDLGLGDTNKIDSQTTEIVELQFVAGSEGMGVFLLFFFAADFLILDL